MFERSSSPIGSFFRLEPTEKRHIIILAVIAAAVLLYTFMGERFRFMAGISNPPLHGMYERRNFTLNLAKNGGLVANAGSDSVTSGSWKVLDPERFVWRPQSTIELPQQTCRYRFEGFDTLWISGCGLDGMFTRM